MPRTTENLSVRIAPEMREQLDRIATNMDRSRNWLITEAIQHYLDIYQWQVDLIEERLQKAESNDAVFVAHNDVLDRIEAKITARLAK